MTTANENKALEKVWEPLTIGSTTVKNRIMMTAQSASFGKDNLISDRHIEYYRERAKGGAALFICEQQGAHRYSKGSFYEGCTAWEPRSIPQYAKLAEAVHEHGARQFAQLFGCGVHDKGTTIMDEWHPLWGVSKIPSFTHREIPMVMEKQHIDEIVEAFAQSALNVMVSGIDGIEIHAAHSYLLGQFLSRVYNKRDDEYGGSVSNRARVLVEIAEATRKKVGTDFTMGVRLSFDEFMGDVGITAEESEEVLEILASTGLYDFFNISGGGYHTLHMAVPTMNVEPGYMIDFARRAKAVVGDRGKVFTVGRIIDLHMAEEVVRSGAADMVAMTRAQMADPFLVDKYKTGRENEIIRCMGANECIARTFDQRPSVCQVNPATGREHKWNVESIIPASDSRKVIVVGGGIAGMHTAEMAAKRGHKVVLMEKSNELGGHLNLLKKFPTRKEWDVAIDNLRRAMNNHNVEVRLSTEATTELLKFESPDALVIATGSSWDNDGCSTYRPDRDSLPGHQQDNVINVGAAASRLMEDPDSLGNKVVILEEAGTYLALGVAEILSAKGKEVTIITPLDMVGDDVLRHLDLPFIMPRLLSNDVEMKTQVNIDRVIENTVYYGSIWGGAEKQIDEVDTVILSMLKSCNDEFYQSVRNEFTEVHRVGDCLAPRKPAQLMYEAHELGRSL
jgi:2,4-dienoyl-CoA reductase-like NADH-dependent reductase (Old Yellow Enzyme family)/thioredoxin reductase